MVSCCCCASLALPRELALPRLDYGSSSDVGAVASTPHVVGRGSGVGLRASAVRTRTRGDARSQLCAAPGRVVGLASGTSCGGNTTVGSCYSSWRCFAAYTRAQVSVGIGAASTLKLMLSTASGMVVSDSTESLVCVCYAAALDHTDLRAQTVPDRSVTVGAQHTGGSTTTITPSRAGWANSFHPTAATGAVAVDCHSSDCTPIAPRPGSGSVQTLPTFCETAICPFHPAAGSGKGTCQADPSVTAGVAPTSCRDHLSCGAGCDCAYVVGMGWPCSTDMSQLGAPQYAGQMLSSFCPEVCNACTGSSRYCADNARWRDSLGRGCSSYGGSPACASDLSVMAACPMTCNICGDCCSETYSSCYFYDSRTTELAPVTVTGGKHKTRVRIGDGRYIPYMDTVATVGVFDFTSQNWLAADVDGVLGLNMAQYTCTPSCSVSFWENMTSTGNMLFGSSNPGVQYGDAFALCLAGPYPTWDIGGVKTQHYIDMNQDGQVDASDIHYMPVHQPSLSYTGKWKTATGPTAMRVGAFTLDMTPAELSPHRILFDSTISKLLLPVSVFAKFVSRFTVNFAVMDRNTANPIYAAEFTNTTHGCAGPIHDDYDPDLDLPTIWITTTDGNSNRYSMAIDARHWAVKRSQVDGLPPAPPGTTYICMAVSVSVSDDIVIGLVGMKEYYTIFDRTNMQIGVAIAGDCSVSDRYRTGRTPPGPPPRPPPPSPPARPVNPCSSRPCQNGGTCTYGQGLPWQYTYNGHAHDTFFCDCATGYSGPVCADAAVAGNPCDANPSPCGGQQNVCSDYRQFSALGVRSPIACRCADGKRGPNAVSLMGIPSGYDSCDIDVDECAQTPCHNGGTCTDSTSDSTIAINAYTCHCPWPYTGPQCGTNNMPSPDPYAGVSCSDIFYSATFTTGLTDNCCAHAIDCVHGYPETCSTACARHWLPYWRRCQPWLEVTFPNAHGVAAGSSHSGVSLYSDFSLQCEAVEFDSDHDRCDTAFMNAALTAVFQRCCGRGFVFCRTTHLPTRYVIFAHCLQPPTQ